MKTLLALAAGFALFVGGSLAFRKLVIQPKLKAGKQATLGPTPQNAIDAARHAIGGRASVDDTAVLASAGAGVFEAAEKAFASIGSSSSSSPSSPTAAPSTGSSPVPGATTTEDAQVNLAASEYAIDQSRIAQGLPPIYSDQSPSYAELSTDGPTVNTGQGASNPQITDANSVDWGTDTSGLAAQETTPGTTVAAGDFSDAVTASESI